MIKINDETSLHFNRDSGMSVIWYSKEKKGMKTEIKDRLEISKDKKGIRKLYRIECDEFKVSNLMLLVFFKNQIFHPKIFILSWSHFHSVHHSSSDEKWKFSFYASNVIYEDDLEHEKRSANSIDFFHCALTRSSRISCKIIFLPRSL